MHCLSSQSWGGRQDDDEEVLQRASLAKEKNSSFAFSKTEVETDRRRQLLWTSGLCTHILTLVKHTESGDEEEEEGERRRKKKKKREGFRELLNLQIYLNYYSKGSRAQQNLPRQST